MQSAKLENFTIATATTVSVDARPTINASATGRGNGGKVVLWSDNQTTFAGTILAKGGAKGGDGGFVEMSSHGQLAFTGNVNTGAPRGAAGTLLLDPADFYIVPRLLGVARPVDDDECPDSNPACDRRTSSSRPTTPTRPGQTATSSFALDQHQLGQRQIANPERLSRHQHHRLRSVIKNTGGGNLVLRADNSGTGTGTVNFLPVRVVSTFLKAPARSRSITTQEVRPINIRTQPTTPVQGCA